MKTERTTVSLPGDIMDAAQRHCDETSIKFSNYVEKLIRVDLQAEGKIADAGLQRAELIAAAEEVGTEAALDAIIALKRRKKRAA